MPRRDEIPASVEIRRDGFVYRFDALSDREQLLAERADGTCDDVLRDRPEVAVRLRAALSRRLGLCDLSELVRIHAGTARALRELGYL